MAVAKQLLQSGGDLQTLPLSLPADKQAGKRRAVALTICAYLSMFQLLQTGCYTLLQGSEVPHIPADLLATGGTSQVTGNFPLS